MTKLDAILTQADGIVMCSPSYFANVTGLMKDLIDRTRPLKMAKYRLKNKYFSVIATWGLRAGGLNTVQEVLNQFALIHGMVVVGAVGHPLLMANLPTETGQMEHLKEFRNPAVISEVAQINVESLAQRFWDLMQEY
nr:Iron-sulfur flavoprotein [Candidatus Prometheoarchaeum syntrophicum]